MFTIDLLKGQGVVKRSGSGGVIVAVAGLAPPVIASLLLLTTYITNNIGVTVLTQQRDFYQKKVESSPIAMSTKTTFEQKEKVINARLSEIASCIGRHTQWSPILVGLVEHMPDSMLLNRLEVLEDFVSVETAGKDDPNTKVIINVPKRTLRITVNTPADSEGDRAIGKFEYDLRVSDPMNLRFSAVRRVSQHGPTTFEGRRVVSYEIDCLLTRGL